MFLELDTFEESGPVILWNDVAQILFCCFLMVGFRLCIFGKITTKGDTVSSSEYHMGRLPVSSFPVVRDAVFGHLV